EGAEGRVGGRKHPAEDGNARQGHCREEEEARHDGEESEMRSHHEGDERNQKNASNQGLLYQGWSPSLRVRVCSPSTKHPSRRSPPCHGGWWQRRIANEMPARRDPVPPRLIDCKSHEIPYLRKNRPGHKRGSAAAGRSRGPPGCSAGLTTRVVLVHVL